MCEIYTLCFKESSLGAVEVFARQMLNEESDIICQADAQGAAKVLVSAINVIGARQKRLLGDSLRSLFPTKRFPTRIMHLLSNCFRT